MSNKFEQLLDLIVNEETEKAEQLFHEIVVERSRSIYESLLQDAEQEVQEKVGGNAVDSMIDEIETEEEEVTVEAEDDGEEAEIDMTMAGDEEMAMAGDEEAGEESDVEERLDDIEAMLQQFQDELDSALAQIEGGEESEEAGEEEEDGEEEAMPAESIVREYKEKVGEPYKSGAAEVKSDGAQSPVAKKGGSMPTAKGVDMAATGSEGQHDHGSKNVKAPKSMNATTEPRMSKVGEAYKSGGAQVGKGDGAESPIEGN